MMDYIRAALDVFKNMKSQHRKIVELESRVHEKDRKILELEKRNDQLSESLKIRGQIVFKDNAYWRNEEDITSGPYCTLCYDDGHKLIRKLIDNTSYCQKSCSGE